MLLGFLFIFLFFLFLEAQAIMMPIALVFSKARLKIHYYILLICIQTFQQNK